jgi:hypothetical protein
MPRLQYRDLPRFQDLAPEQLKELFGAGLIRPSVERLEERLVRAGSLDLHNHILTIQGTGLEDWARVQFRTDNNQMKVEVDLFSDQQAGALTNAWQSQGQSWALDGVFASSADPVEKLKDLQGDYNFDHHHESYNLSDV